MRAMSVVFLLLGVSNAAAQEEVQLLFPGTDESDPIGTGDTGSLRDVPPPVPRVVVPDVVEGDVLSAIPGVREIDHRVNVQIADGLARVSIEQRFVHRGHDAAEVRYRVRVPEDARIGTLEVCRDEVCEGGGEGEGFGVTASSRRVDDAIVLRVAPIERGVTTSVRWSYLTEARIRGGVARVDLPARGHDARIAPSQVHVETTDLLALSLDGAPAGESVALESWRAIEVSGRLRSGGNARLSVTHFECAEADARSACVRVHVEAGDRRPQPERLLLYLDVSPSTFGPMHGRMAPTLAAIRANAHPESTLRAVAFAGRAEALLSEATPPARWPSDLFARAQGLELGASTNLGAAAAAITPRRGDHVLVLGDGGLSAGPRSEQAMARLRASGARVSVVNVGEQDTSPELRALVEATGGVDLAVGSHADVGAGPTERLQEIVARLVSPIVARRVTGTPLQALHAGDGANWLGVVPRNTTFAAGGASTRVPRRIESDVRALAGGTERVTGATDRPFIAVAAHPSAPPSPERARSVPSRSVLSILRTRLVPAARRCLRADRRGRANYSVQATYELLLADREVASSRVTGELPEALRACLEDTIDELEIPRFDGRVRVRYPIYTEVAPPPPVIELVPDVAGTIDAVVGDEPTRPLE